MAAPKHTDIDPDQIDPNLGELGSEQPFAILGFDPGRPHPGREAIAHRRRLIVRLLLRMQGDNRVPLTLQRVNAAHDRLRDHYDAVAAVAVRYRQRQYWGVNAFSSSESADFTTLFAQK